MEKYDINKKIQENIKRNENIRKIDSDFDKWYKEYIKYMSLLHDNTHFITKQNISSKDAKELIERLNKECDKKIKKYASDSINARFGITERSTKKQDRSLKFKKLLKTKTAIFSIAFALGLVSGVKVGEKIREEKIYNTKISECENKTEDIVLSATHAKYGNFDYSNGVLSRVSDDEASNSLITYINYDEIANYIETSDNPDLALFTLYEKFGKSKDSSYSGITNRTCKFLDFDNEKIENFNDYIYANGYSSYSEYFKACKKELIDGNDDVLDNISFKVKKLTR